MEPTALDVATAVVALYGAVLATTVFVAQLRSRQTRLKVGAWVGTPLRGGDGSSPEGEVLVVTITNVGEVDALATALGTLFRRTPLLWRLHAKWRQFGIVPGPLLESQLPEKLRPAEQVTLVLPADQFLASIREQGRDMSRLHLVVQDSHGRYHQSARLSNCLGRTGCAGTCLPDGMQVE
jgi:hypothetical protein